MADRIALMDRGKLVQVGTPREIYGQPANAHVASFIGETNLIEGEIEEVIAGAAKVRTLGGFLTGRLSAYFGEFAAGEKVVVSVRPEAWRFTPFSGNAIKGRLVERSYGGQRVRYWIETMAGRMQVVELNPHELREPCDDAVEIHVHREDVVVMKHQQA